jgi:hypothetical protein
MFLHTTTVTVLPGFRLQLSFNNGVAGEVCLLDELWGEMFEPLKDEALFATARQDDEMGTVIWANCQIPAVSGSDSLVQMST